MKLDGEWIKRLFALWKEGKYDIAKKEVFKYRLKNYEKLDRIEDKFFLDYRMAYHEYLDKNEKMANYYLDKLNDMFEDEYNKKAMEGEYYKFKWLYVNANYDNLNEDILVKEMASVHEYYKEIKDYKLACLALGNMFRINGEGEKVLETLDFLLSNYPCSEKIFEESILQDCEEINHNLYIKALKIVNKYKVNIDVI